MWIKPKFCWIMTCFTHKKKNIFIPSTYHHPKFSRAPQHRPQGRGDRHGDRPRRPKERRQRRRGGRELRGAAVSSVEHGLSEVLWMARERFSMFLMGAKWKNPMKNL